MEQRSSDAMGSLARTWAYDGRSYQAKLNDPHYGATEPLEAERCRCDQPAAVLDVDDVAEVAEHRCLYCGKPVRYE